VNRITHISNKSNRVSIELLINTEPYTNVEVCDELPLGSVLEGGSYCINRVTGSDGRLVLRYSIRALRPQIIWNYVYIVLHHPLGLAIKELRVPIKTSVTITPSPHIPIPIKSKELKVATTGYMEPVIDRVRPYVIGDDFKLIIPKSFLMPGGLRIKVFSAESQLKFKDRFVVLAIPSMWYCISDMVKLFMEAAIYNTLYYAKLNKYRIRIIVPSTQILDTEWLSINNQIHEYLSKIYQALCNSIDTYYIKNWIEKLKYREINTVIITVSDSLLKLREILESTEIKGIYVIAIEPKPPSATNYLPRDFRDLIHKIVEEESKELYSAIDKLKKIGYIVEVVKGLE